MFKWLIRSKRDHVTAMLLELHWLPIKRRLTFKNLLLTFKCLHGLSISTSSSVLPATLSIRSSYQWRHRPPTSRNQIGGRPFSYATPRAWNQLLFTLRQWASVDQFNVALKTHIFTYYFDIRRSYVISQLFVHYIKLICYCNRYIIMLIHTIHVLIYIWILSEHNF